MEVRGSILKGIDNFVKINHSSSYENWKGKLSKKAKEVLENSSMSDWYSIEDTMIEPSKIVCELLFSSEKQGAWEMGRFAAEQGLTGIYKVFVLVTSPTFILKRAPRIMTTFYRPSQLSVVDSSNYSVKIQCTELPLKSSLLEFRIAGWIERAAEICGCKDVKINISNTLSEGGDSFDMDISWK